MVFCRELTQLSLSAEVEALRVQLRTGEMMLKSLGYSPALGTVTLRSRRGMRYAALRLEMPSVTKLLLILA